MGLCRLSGRERDEISSCLIMTRQSGMGEFTSKLVNEGEILVLRNLFCEMSRK